ncbi:MAG: hypothetical protein R3248_13295 [Candidatus Promineifilaceae bacterium]|nr:hypothetical protein [Candidatus Promineifilaceae bacterium]
MSEPYKLLLAYDVKKDQMQEYYRFMLGRYVPVMQAMGLEMSEAWHTAYGEFPDRLVGFVARDRQTVDELLESDSWHSLNEELRRFVTNLDHKLIPYREGFQF